MWLYTELCNTQTVLPFPATQRKPDLAWEDPRVCSRWSMDWHIHWAGVAIHSSCLLGLCPRTARSLFGQFLAIARYLIKISILLILIINFFFLINSFFFQLALIEQWPISASISQSQLSRHIKYSSSLYIWKQWSSTYNTCTFLHTNSAENHCHWSHFLWKRVNAS